MGFSFPKLICLLLVSFAVIHNPQEHGVGLGKEIQIKTAADLEAYQLYNAAVNLERESRVDEAAEVYEKALAIKFDLLEAINNLGGIARLKGDVEVAKSLYEKLLVLAKKNADHELTAAALNNLGLIAFVQGTHSKVNGKDHQGVNDANLIRNKAMPLYIEAIQTNPKLVDAVYNLANAFQILGEDEKAYNQFLRVLELDPNHVNGNMNMGNLLIKRNRFDLAVEYHKRSAVAAAASISSSSSSSSSDSDSVSKEALELQVNTLNNLGQTLRENKDLYGALEQHRKSIELDPSQIVGRIQAIVAQRGLVLWTTWDKEHRELMNTLNENPNVQISDLSPYDSLLVPSKYFQNSTVSLADIARDTVSRYNVDPKNLELIPEKLGQPLRIGYISYDMRDHPMGHLTHGLFVHHDRSKFKVYVYMYGEFDTSVQRRRIERAADKFIDMVSMPTDAAVQQIKNDKIDILIDLMAHTRGARVDIVAAFPAQTYINYLGYPGTSGFNSQGAYIMADQYVLPAETLVHKTEVTESVIALDHSYQANDFNSTVKFCTSFFGAAFFEKCRSSSGLPTMNSLPSWKSFRFANFNTLHKMEPSSFDVWAQILVRVPRSVLYLLEPKLEANVTENILAEMKKRGVGRERIIFAPRVSKLHHLNRLVGVDLFLDSFVYGAHSTATDALWSGIPVLTMRGVVFPGRVGCSLLSAVGLEELIVDSTDQFEDVAVQIATRPILLQSLKAKLGRNLLRFPLFHSELITRSIERGVLATQERGKSKQDLIIVARRNKMHMLRTFQSLLDKGLKSQQSGNIGAAVNIYSRILESVNTSVPEEKFVAAQTCHLFGLAVEDPILVQHAIKLSTSSPGLFHGNQAHLWRTFGNVERAQTSFLAALKSYVSTNDCASFSSTFESLVHLCFVSNEEHQQCVGLENLGSVLVEYLDRLLENQICAKLLEENIMVFQGILRGLDSMISFFVSVESFALASRLLEKTVWFEPNEQVRFTRKYQRGSLLGKMSDSSTDMEKAMEYLKNTVLQENRVKFQGKVRDSILKKHGFQQQQQQQQQKGHEKQKRIVIYCYEYGQTWWPNWGPRSPEQKGAGGSEEAVIFLSRELAKLNYQVEIYADPLERDFGITAASGNVIWLPYYAFKAEDDADIFVAWRYHLSMFLGQNAKKKILWLHDVVSDLGPQIAHLTKTNVIDQVLAGSRFHVRTLPTEVHASSKVLGYALQEGYFEDGENQRLECIYASAPNRGLEQLLSIWPMIHRAVPNAHLRIYYGFSGSFMQWGKKNIVNFDGWVHHLNETIHRLSSMNVHYVGMVHHRELAKAYALSGFTLYPTSYPETGCVSLMKAMAMGSIPITSRFPNSSLPDLTGQWDLGPPEGTSKLSISEDVAFLREYANSVIKGLVGYSSGELEKHRSLMKVWARRELLWSSVALRFKDYTDP